MGEVSHAGSYLAVMKGTNEENAKQREKVKTVEPEHKGETNIETQHPMKLQRSIKITDDRGSLIGERRGEGNGKRALR